MIPGIPFLCTRYVGDLVPGLAAIYSTRKLRMDYFGPACVLRRDSDNTSTTVSFDSAGKISLSSSVSAGGPKLSNWIGANNAFVSRWYDQSGNSNDALQLTLVNQPQIITAGVVNTINGQATIHFNGSQLLNAVYDPTIDLDSTMSGLFVVSFDNFSSIRTVLDKRGPASTYTGYTFFSSASADVNFQWNTSSMSSATESASLSTSTLYSLSYYATKGSSVDFWKKLSDLGSGALTATGSSVTTNSLLIGGHVDTPSFQLVGNISEFMLFNLVLTTAQRNAIINNQITYFGL